MKRFLLALVATVITAGVFAQTEVKTEEPVKFKEHVYDFGKVKQGVPVTHEFVFTNSTDKPIVVESASATCGCTTPEWPQTPIAKGKTDKIKAGFNAAAAGVFTKPIYVKIAGVDKPIELRITGEVLTAEAYAKYEQDKGSKKSK